MLNDPSKRKIFLTFADSRMARSVSRIVKQAEALNVYDEIVSLNESNLAPEFLKEFRSRLVYGSRGYGYWCWKPQVILQVLDRANEGDVVQYTDAGCHLNLKGKKRLSDYFSLAEIADSGILAFQAKPPSTPLEYDGRALPDLNDYRWIKGDLLEFFGVRFDEKLLYSPSVGATVIFVRKCFKSLSIITQWLDVIKHNFFLLDDSPSLTKNLNGFVEHRHDQAIFSLLCKINRVETISSYEYWYPQIKKMKPDWMALDEFPIHAKRDKKIGMLNQFLRINSLFRRICG